MKRQTFQRCVFLGLILLVTSCANEDPGKVQENHKMSEGAIYELIRTYANADKAGTRANVSFQITDIQRQKYSISEQIGDSLMTRGEVSSDPFELQTVTLDFGDTKGYAIVSDDERLNQVFLYAPDGNISDTAFIKPLKHLIDGMPLTAANMIVNENNQSTRATNTVTPLVEPLVRFKWGQFSPFNDFAVYCTCSSCRQHGNHTPIGCVATAVAQTIATLGTFSGSFYGSRDLDFAALPVYGSSMTATQKEQVGHFLQEIALNCQMKFACEGSGTHAKPVYNYLTDLGYNCTYEEGNLNPAKTLELLKKGIPHLVGGFNSDGGGHMWVVDGMRLQNGQYHYHCNWGWDGSSNCWSVDNEFTLASGDRFQKNREHIYINAKLK